MTRLKKRIWQTEQSPRLRIPHHTIQLQPRLANQSKPNPRKETLRPTYHTTILSIPTLHHPPHLKPHLLINPHIRHPLRTLKITLNPLSIRPLRNSFKQQPPHPHPLCLRPHSNNITKVISPRIIPDLCLRFLLPLFPDPVPVCAEAAVAQVTNVVEELVE